jgi:D-aspartate ligase
MHSPSSLPHAVVVGLDCITGLQTARILARRGVPVIGVASDPGHYCCQTRVTREILQADTGSEEVVRVLESLGESLELRAVLYPCNDASVLMLARHRDRLKGAFHVVLPETGVLETLQDKISFARVAEEIGLPAPRTFLLHDRADAEHAAAHLTFPCILKPPLKTTLWKQNTTAKVYRVESAADLLSLYDRCSGWAEVLMVQEWIDGPDSELYSCNCYFNRESEPLVTFVARKLRQWPPRTGTSCLGEECRNDTVLQLTLHLFRSVGYHGLGYLEVKRDARSGKHYVIEANIGRPTGRSAIAEAGGVELLYAMYCDTTGRPLPEALEQRYGDAKWIFWRQDLRSAWYYWRQGELTIGQWVVLVLRFDAPLVLAGGLILLGAVPLMRHPELATISTVFLLYVNFPAILTKQHGIPAPIAGTFILLLVLPLVHLLVLRRQPFRVDRTFLLMLGLLAAFSMSSLVAVDQLIARKYLLEYIFEGIILYLLVINVIRTRRTLRRVLWTLLAAGALLGSLAAYQEVTGSFDDLGGLAYRNYTAVQDFDREGPAKRERWNRAHGPVNEPNRFAQILLVLLPFAFYLHRREASVTARAISLLLGVLIFAGIALTLSRAAIVASVLLSLILLRMRWLQLSRLAVFGVLLVGIASVHPFFANRMSSIFEAGDIAAGDNRQADSSMRARTTLMLAALKVYFDHPIIGVGPGQFGPFYGAEYARDPSIKMNDEVHRRSQRAHSLFPEIAAEGGTLALGLFTAIIALLAVRLWRISRALHPRDGDGSDLATALWLALVMYLCTGVFLHLSYLRYYWFLIALAAVGVHLLGAHRAAGGAFPARPWNRDAVRTAGDGGAR